MRVEEFKAGFSKLHEDITSKTYQQWLEQTSKCFACTENQTHRLQSLFIRCEVLRMSKVKDGYFDFHYESAGPLYDLFSFIQVD